MLKKLLITAVALFNITYLTIAYSDNALPVEAKALNSNTDPTGQWVSVFSNLPVKEDSGAIESVIEFNKKLYAAGQDYIQHAFIYVYNGDNKNPKWTSVGAGLPIINYTSTNTMLAICNNALYIGGIRWTNPSDKSIVFISRYNGDGQHPSWTPVSIAGLPTEGYPTQLMVRNNKMYVTFDLTDDPSSPPSIFVYDDKKQLWSSVINGLDLLDIRAMAVFHDKLYVIGWTADPNEGSIAYVYNGNDDAPSWKLISPDWSTSPALYANMLSICNDTLFVGGMNADNTSFVYAYNGDDQNPNWRDVSNGLPTQQDERDGLAISSLTASNNTLYAGAGGIGSPVSPFVYVYNGKNDAPNWVPLENNGLPTSLEVSLTAFNNTLYMNRVNTMAEFLYALPLPTQQVSAGK